MRERETEDGGDKDNGCRGADYPAPAPEPTCGGPWRFRCAMPRLASVSRTEVTPGGAPVTRPTAGEVSWVLTRARPVMMKAAAPAAGWHSAPELHGHTGNRKRSDSRHKMTEATLALIGRLAI